MRTGWYSATTAEKDRTAFLQTLSRPYNSNSRKDRSSLISPHSGSLSLTVSNTNSNPISRTSLRVSRYRRDVRLLSRSPKRQTSG